MSSSQNNLTLKSLFHQYISRHLHVSISVVCILWVYAQQSTIDIPVVYYAYVFASTLAGYHITTYQGNIVYLLKRLLLLEMILLISLGWSSVLHWGSVFLILLVSVLTFNYVHSLLWAPLRKLKGIKIYIVSSCWATMTVAIPFLEYTTHTNILGAILFFFQVFVFVIALMIPFEIRDMHTDARQLKTIAQTLGVYKSKVIGVLLMIAFLILSHQEISDILITLVAMSGILMTKQQQHRYFCSFWIEAIPTLWAFLVFLEQGWLK